MSATLNNRLATLLSDPFEAMLTRAGCDSSRGGAVRQMFVRDAAPLSLWEDELRVYLEVDVPGLSREDLDLTIEDGKLFIRGQRGRVEHAGHCRHDERRFGRFERIVTLADTIDTNSIDAGLNDGVLTITLSKKAEAQPHRIPVKYHGQPQPSGGEQPPSGEQQHSDEPSHQQDGP